MKNLKKQLTACFNKAADRYDQYCQLQYTTGSILINLLRELSPKRIIDLGCGTGLISERLIRHYPTAQLHAVDIAENSLAKTKIRLKQYAAQIYIADYDHLPQFNQPFDLAFSNMALHWSFNFLNTLQAIKRVIRAEGLLAFSVPLAGSLIELNQQVVNPFMGYDLILKYLQQMQYKIEHFHQENYLFYFPDSLSALRSIKNVGANFYLNRSQKGLRSNITYFMSATDSTCLTYNIGYFIARKNDFF